MTSAEFCNAPNLDRAMWLAKLQDDELWRFCTELVSDDPRAWQLLALNLRSRWITAEHRRRQELQDALEGRQVVYETGAPA
jgi:hypothetical protein